MDEDPSIGTDVLAALVDAAPDAMLVATEDGAIVLASAACARVLGRSPSELIGTDLTEFLPGTAPFCSMPGRGPDGRADGPAVLPTSLQRGDGSTVEVELAISTVGLGGRRYLCATVRDLRGRGKEEQRFRALLNAAPDATVIVNADGRIVLTNRQVESVFGYQGDELLGRAVETLIPGRFRPGHAQQRDDYASSPNVRGMGTGMDLFALRKDGTEFPVEVSLAPLRTEDGLLISAAIRDSTERLRVENSAARMR